MQTKQHYKMYKDGKHWVFAAITVVAVGLGTAVGQDMSAHADTAPSNDSASQTTTNSSATAGTTTVLKTSQTSGNGSNTTTDTDQSTDTTENATDKTDTTDTTTDDSSTSSDNVNDGTNQDADTSAGNDTDSLDDTNTDTNTDMNSDANTNTNTDTDTNPETNTETAQPTTDPDADTTPAPAADDTTSDTTPNADPTTPADAANVEPVNEEALLDDVPLAAGDGTDNTETPVPATAPLAAPMMASAAVTPVTDQSNFDITYDTATLTATINGLLSQATSDTLVIPSTVTGADGKTYQVTTIAPGAFASSVGRNKNVTTVVIGDGITTIGANAFAYLSNLQVVDLSENHTLTTIGDNAFVSDGLTSLTLPTTVTTIGNGAFEYNSQLTQANLGETQLQSIGDLAFLGTDLTSLALPSTLQTIGTAAFKYNSNLATIDFSQATQLQSIGDMAFANDASLTTLSIPTLTTMGTAAFAGATSLTSVTLGDGVKQVGDYAFSTYADGDSMIAGDTALTSVTFGNGLTSIGNYAFTYDGKITTLDLPASLQSIGDYAFGAMTSKDADGNTISGLTTVTFAPDSQLQTIGNAAFIYDSYLTNVTLPASLETIGDQAFLANTALTTINLPASLTTVGANAFTYDTALQTIDTTQATALTTIKSGAFEYAGLTGTLTLPENLVTIGDLAFAGNNLTTLAVSADTQLATIGASAFAYNGLTGQLDLTPTAVTTIGKQAFFGNQLSDVFVPATTTVGKSAFDYNRLTTVSLPGGQANLAQNQTATIFTSTAQLKSIDDLFETAVGDLTNDDLVLTNLSNGVTYQDGQFTIPADTAGFSFNWTLTDTTGTTYTGVYQVVLNDPHIKVANSTVWYGDGWQPTDNVVSAEMTDGTPIDPADLTVKITDANGNTVAADDVTQVAGTYSVTYSYGDGNSATAIVTVVKREATYMLTGYSEVTYTGNEPVVDPSQYQVTLSDGFVYTLKAGDLIVAPTAAANASKTADGLTASALPNVGSYQITLNPDTITRLQAEVPASSYFDWTDLGSDATLDIVPAALTVTVADASKDAGEADPTPVVTIVGADDQAVSDSGLTVTRVAGETAGTYDYQLDTSALNANYTVGTATLGKLTINSVDPTLTGSDYTMTVGGKTPTAADFQASATDTNAQAVPVTDITVDLSQADTTKAGDYPVTLSYGDVTQTVTLHVVAANTGDGGNTTDPTDPTEPTDPSTPDVTNPTDPEKPTKPVTPTKPTTPGNAVHDIISDRAVQKDGAGATIAIVAKHSAQTTLDRHNNGIGAMIQANPAAAVHTAGAAAKIVSATSASAVIAGQSQPDATGTPATQQTELPQTNEHTSAGWAVLGLLLGSLGVTGFRKRRHE